MYVNFIKIARFIRYRFFKRRELLTITNFFESSFSDYFVENGNSLILLDPFTVPEWSIASSYFINVLADIKQSRIKTFSSQTNISHPVFKNIYKSINVSGHIHTRLKSHSLIKEKEKICKNIRFKIKTKEELFNLEVNNIAIGIDIYETYLTLGNITVNFDESLWSVVDEVVGLLLFWEDFIKSNVISSIVLSHDCYKLNALAKVCYKNNIPVFMPNSVGMQRVNHPFSLYGTRLPNYRKYFNNLSNNEKKEALKWGSERINQRLSGSIDDIFFAKESAFIQPSNSKHVLKKSNKKKVLIAAHDFYDNPQAYGEMLFTDFYEWLMFLVKVSKKVDYDWYIKTHPGYTPKLLKVMEDILNDILKDSDITLLPPKSSSIQLAEEGLDLVLTCWGSVGHEFPLLGVQVINASIINPHMAYDFNWHPKSLEEYEKLLLNLPSLNKAIVPSDVYEFYFIHFKYTHLDDFIFNSHKKMLREIGTKQIFSIKVYLYFISGLSREKHYKIISDMRAFIVSNKRNFFINGPEGDL